MKPGEAGDHIAVLIDAENVSYKHISGLLAAVANYGTASVRRIYGDWTSPAMVGWSECLLEHSLVPIQQFSYTKGKNATDGAMIIDAMDLLYTGRFSGFCLVTSDSDFTRLAARIREQGITVYGFGNRHNTHRALVAACNEFVYLDALPMQADEPNEAPVPPAQAPTKALVTDTVRSPPPRVHPDIRPAPPSEPRALIPPQTGGVSLKRPHVQPTRRPLDQAALDGLRSAINSSSIVDNEDYVNLAEVGNYLVKISPDLNARNYGFLGLRDFALASGIVQLKMKTRDPAPPIALVRLKD